MISLVKDNVEHPLVLLEFSTAVFTEDHELQRFDGMLTAVKNGVIFAKLSPLDKESPGEMGGNTSFDYRKPYALIYQNPKFHNAVPEHFDLPVTEKKEKYGNYVEAQDESLSCPKPMLEFENFLKIIIQTNLSNTFDENTWLTQTRRKLKEDPARDKWEQELKNLKLDDLTKEKTNRTTWEKDHLLVKINRFGHAMDPERGMLAYFSAFKNNQGQKCRMWFTNKKTWYKQSNEEKITEYISNNGLKTPYDFLICFMYGAGLHNNQDFRKIVETYKESKRSCETIPLDEFIKNNYLKLSKPLRTIFTCSNGLSIEYAKIEGKQTVVEGPIAFIKFEFSAYEDKPDFFGCPNITPIDDWKNSKVSEDDVSYIIIHDILLKQNFSIHAASYPGAQGDRKTLPDKNKGTGQKREYIDIIARRKNVFLIESKADFSMKSQIISDINRILKYKTGKHLDALKNFFRSIPDSVEEITQPKLAVGFFKNEQYTKEDIEKLAGNLIDYVFAISYDKENWEIIQLNSKDDFSQLKGKVDIPEHYVVKKN